MKYVYILQSEQDPEREPTSACNWIWTPPGLSSGSQIRGDVGQLCPNRPGS